MLIDQLVFRFTVNKYHRKINVSTVKGMDLGWIGQIGWIMVDSGEGVGVESLLQIEGKSLNPNMKNCRFYRKTGRTMWKREVLHLPVVRGSCRILC